MVDMVVARWIHRSELIKDRRGHARCRVETFVLRQQHIPHPSSNWVFVARQLVKRSWMKE
jgi:hypothetical protein